MENNFAIEIEKGIIDFSERKAKINDENIKVLESIKEILTLGDTDIITTPMVAEYFNVSQSTIRSLLIDHREEFEENGLYKLTGSQLIKKLESCSKQLSTHKGYFICGDRRISYQNNILWTKRCMLLASMLLKKSEVAKELRRRILDIVDDSMEGKGNVTVILEEIDKEKDLALAIGDAIVKGDLNSVIELNAKINDLKNKRIIDLEKKNKDLETIIDVAISDDELFDIGLIGKLLKPYCKVFGAINIYKYLHSQKILMDKPFTQKHNAPYDKYYEYFELRTVAYEYEKQRHICTRTYFNGKGLKWFLNELVNANMINKNIADNIVEDVITEKER